MDHFAGLFNRHYLAENCLTGADPGQSLHRAGPAVIHEMNSFGIPVGRLRSSGPLGH